MLTTTVHEKERLLRAIAAARQVLNDIDSMRRGPVTPDEGETYVESDDACFGPFEVGDHDPDAGYSIEWPNLDISADKLREALRALPS